MDGSLRNRRLGGVCHGQCVYRLQPLPIRRLSLKACHFQWLPHFVLNKWLVAYQIGSEALYKLNNMRNLILIINDVSCEVVQILRSSQDNSTLSHTMQRVKSATQIILGFKYSSCSEWVFFLFGWFTDFWILCDDVSEHSVSFIFIGGVGRTYTAYEDGTDRVFRNVKT